MKTSELTGNALNWAVNYAEGLRGIFAPVDYCGKWEHGGPIIEREGLQLRKRNDFHFPAPFWQAGQWSDITLMPGPTPLIAAMRCYVASKLGDDVDVPEELTK
jgi:hypothetical protein